MYKELKVRLMNSLKAEFDYVSKFETDKATQLSKLLDVMNAMRVVTNYENIEPSIAKQINELAKKEKWEER